MRRSHLLMLAGLLLLVLVIAVVVQARKGNQPDGSRAGDAKRAAAAKEPARGAKASAVGLERCRKKCAGHKGYVYRARQKAEPEYCGCV
jgi:hypothetical protein